MFQILDTVRSIAGSVETVGALLDRIGELQAVMDAARGNKGKNAVTLSTIHSSKGLEYRKVYMMDLFDGEFPSTRSIDEYHEGNSAAMEEEVRLFYVGVTRAKESLELLSAKFCNGENMRPSRFIGTFLDAGESVKVSANIASVSQEREFGLKQDTVAEDIQVDTEVRHVKFGRSIISSLDRKNDIIEVNFE